MILITGATSGIGRACAELLHAKGERLVLVGRDLSKIDGAFEGQTRIACDVADEAKVQALVAQLKGLGGPIHGWVLAAGGQEVRPLLMENAASLGRTWQVNVAGALGLMGAALKARLVARGGSIVFLSSAVTHAGGPGMVSYAASKGAIEAAARSLALELAGQAIRVNAVAPGVVRTAMSEKYMAKLTAEQRAHLEAAHPLGLGNPEDVAGPVAFLLSDAARWITGTVLLVDGGLCAH